MKKYIMIFSSFILAIVILLIPNNKVFAREISKSYYSWGYSHRIIYDDVANTITVKYQNSNDNVYVLQLDKKYFYAYFNSDIYIMQSDSPIHVGPGSNGGSVYYYSSDSPIYGTKINLSNFNIEVDNLILTSYMSFNWTGSSFDTIKENNRYLLNHSLYFYTSPGKRVLAINNVGNYVNDIFNTFKHYNVTYNVEKILDDIASYNSGYNVINYPYISVHASSTGFNFYLISDFSFNKKNGDSAISGYKYPFDNTYYGYTSIGSNYSTIYASTIKVVYNFNTDTYTYSTDTSFKLPGNKAAKQTYIDEHGSLDGFYDGILLYQNFSFYDRAIDNYYTFFDYSNFMNNLSLDIGLLEVLTIDNQGKQRYDISFNVLNGFESSYRYQYKTDFTDWIDIDINDFIESSGGNYYYVYSLYYNSKFYARILNSNDEVIVSDEINIDSLSRYKFSGFISSVDYSKVEFTFDIPNYNSICTSYSYENGVLRPIEYDCPALDLDYNIYSSDIFGNLNPDPDVIGIPYLKKQYLYDTGNMCISQTDTILFSNNYLNNYIGNKTIENTGNIESLKLVIDLSGFTADIAYVEFYSNVPFSVDYYERLIEENYIDRVDLTGKSGVMFIPKQINDDMFLNFRFYPGNYSLQLRNTYKSNYNILSYYSVGYCDERNFINGITYICSSNYLASVYFSKGNLEQSLFVVNRDYPKFDTAWVEYDSRYFDYVIYNTLYDNPIFTHPITGEEVTGNTLLDFDSSMSKEQSFFDMVNSGFIHFKGVIVDIFSNISYFFNHLSITLKYFYIIIFSLVIFAFLIKFIL